MKDADLLVLQFVELLANVIESFREIKIFASEQPIIDSASLTVAPAKFLDTPDYADLGVTISVSVDAELVKPLDENRKAVGASLLIRRLAGVWIAEAELGWSGRWIG